MTVTLPIGERIRYWREKKQRKQAAVAGLCGITEEYLSQIERGLKIPSLPVLHALAAELGVPVSALIDEVPKEPAGKGSIIAQDVTRALMGYGPPRSSRPVSSTELRERVESAWRMWQTSPTRFTDAATVLPSLIADAEHAMRVHRTSTDSASRRDTFRATADLYFLLRSYCRRADRVDLSLMVADRGLRAAEDADDPIRFLLDVARCYDLRREDAAVIVHLLDLLQMAPEDLARSRLAQDMVIRLHRRVRPIYRRQVDVLTERLELL